MRTEIVDGELSSLDWFNFDEMRALDLPAITRAVDNILYDLDGMSALDLYERYLGEEEVQNLPASALCASDHRASPISAMIRYDTRYVRATEMNDVSHTSIVSGASKFI